MVCTALGLDHVTWAPDGRHILTTAQFQVILDNCSCSPLHGLNARMQLRVTIWSLVSQRISYIRFPKHARTGLGQRLLSTGQQSQRRYRAGVFPGSKVPVGAGAKGLQGLPQRL